MRWLQQHYQHNGHMNSEQIPEIVKDRGLVCCNPCENKESDMTQRLNNSTMQSLGWKWDSPAKCGSCIEVIVPYIILPRGYEEIYQLHHVRLSGASRQAPKQIQKQLERKWKTLVRISYCLDDVSRSKLSYARARECMSISVPYRCNHCETRWLKHQKLFSLTFKGLGDLNLFCDVSDSTVSSLWGIRENLFHASLPVSGDC